MTTNVFILKEVLIIHPSVYLDKKNLDELRKTFTTDIQGMSRRWSISVNQKQFGF